MTRENSSGSRLEGETGATMGNEGWTETVADGESVVMVVAMRRGAGGRGQLGGMRGKGRGLGRARERDIARVACDAAASLMSSAMPRITCFYAKMLFISALIFTDENTCELVIRMYDDTRARLRQTRDNSEEMPDGKF